MGLLLLVAIICIPILEIAVFIQAGQRLGLWPTLGAVIVTAVVGTALMRFQGLSTLARARESLDAGQVPVAEVFDGLCILIGGALLLTPGFVTDALGFLLMIPPVRAWLRRWCGKHMVEGKRVHIWSAARPPGGKPPGDGKSPIIDGEFEEIVDADRPSGGSESRPHGNDKVIGRGDPDRRP